ncbi:fibronectin type III domain-containing protein [Dactylosporangium sp. CA-139114]|uniref:fibronectin type III domain-containing protein n=1 Tax=Dactylosporangium sp. CA-139114 TaxID=3239931 RepID=UPI003D97755A
MRTRVEQLSRAGVAVLLAAVAGIAFARPAYAATHDVTTTQDADDLGACANPAITTGTGADGRLSLREAVCRARNAGTGTVAVPAGTYALSLGALVVAGGAGPVHLTVTGAGPGSTVVDGGGADRVFDLDPTEAGAVDVTLSGLTISNGRGADGVGGGGILAGAPAAATPDSLTLSDCRVTGNVNDASASRTNAPGGGVAMAGGSLSVSNCTFSANSSGSSPGGGVYFSAQHATDSLTIDGSTFRANTMANISGSGPGATPSGGAALALRADVAGGSMTVTDTTFDANTATGSGSGADARGGAVYVQSGAPAFTRTVFTANTASGTGGAQGLGGALYVAGSASVTYSRITGNTPGLYHAGGTLTATRDWWGCNAGAGGGAGCDAVVSAAGTLSATPVLQLGVAVVPASILTGATATATAGFLTDSAAASVPAGQLGALTGAAVSWSATGGTLSAQQGAIQPGTGTATATFTGTATGAGSVQATVDGQAQSGAVAVRTPPAAPTAVGGAVTGPGVVSVAWTAPPGGADSYRVYASDGSTVDCPASPCAVSGLTPGSPFTFTVSAFAAGIEGPRSSASDPVTALDVPAAPGPPAAAVAGDRSMSLTWTAPAPPVTGYRVETSADGGAFAAVSTGDCAAPATTSCTVSGLTGGGSYRFRVSAGNAAGFGAASAPSAALTAVAAPDAPAIGTATVTGPGTVSVAWTAPPGGADSYRVHASGGSTVDCDASPCAVSGLSAGAQYTFTVSALRAGVEGARSAPSSAVTALDPPAAPGPPAAVVGGDAVLDLTWSAPAAPVTAYRVEVSAGGGAYSTVSTGDCAAPVTAACSMSGLTAGTSYRFRVTGGNDAGFGAASAPSAAVVAVAVPGAPGTPVATVSGDRALHLTWTAPAPPVTGYGVEMSEDGGAFAAVSTGDCAAPAGPSCAVSGLSAGSSYRFRVTARNQAGDGVASAASAATVALAAPGAPAIGPVTVNGSGTVSVTWTGPGGAVDGYRVHVFGGSTVDCAASPCTVPGLSAGVQYTFSVSALRGGVEGALSAASSPVTALAAATPPAIRGAAPADRGTVVTWSPPASAAGITGYTATAQPGGASCDAAADTCSITGLTNGTQYTITVVAHSPAGDSAPSAPATTTPGVAPGAPAAVTAVAGVASITVSWTAGTPGSGIAGYIATATPGPATCETRSATDTSCVLGAEGGRSYTVTVVAKGVHGGDSAASPPSAAVAPTTPTPPATVPDTPLTLATDLGPTGTVAPGKRIVVTGRGFAPHSTVTVTVYSTPTVLTTVTADANGDFSVPVTVPADLPAGEHAFVALGTGPDGTAHTLKLALTVQPAAAAPPATTPAPATGTLPVTGAALSLMLLTGLGLVLTGAAGRLLARR